MNRQLSSAISDAEASGSNAGQILFFLRMLMISVDDVGQVPPPLRLSALASLRIPPHPTPPHRSHPALCRSAIVLTPPSAAVVCSASRECCSCAGIHTRSGSGRTRRKGGGIAAGRWDTRPVAVSAEQRERCRVGPALGAESGVGLGGSGRHRRGEVLPLRSCWVGGLGCDAFSLHEQNRDEMSGTLTVGDRGREAGSRRARRAPWRQRQRTNPFLSSESLLPIRVGLARTCACAVCASVFACLPQQVPCFCVAARASASVGRRS
eukprot:533345-Rhodomonas_salina.3